MLLPIICSKTNYSFERLVPPYWDRKPGRSHWVRPLLVFTMVWSVEQNLRLRQMFAMSLVFATSGKL